MKRYESRYCTFAVPDDWETEPPFAFRERGEEGNRMGAQILERSLADMPSAAEYAKKQKPILAEIYEGFELLLEGPQRIEGPGEGYSISFRYVDEEENPSRGRMIFFTCGPLVCQLFLSGPDGDDSERDRLFEAIGKTFAFRGADALASARAGGLTSEVLRMKQTEAAKGWPGPWRKFPRCCVELPLPNGWEVVIDERDDVLFRHGGAEIRLHRELGENNEAGIWFANRMRRLQQQGDRLLGSEQAELERGSYAAVLYEEKGAVRMWKTAAVMWILDLFLRDQQPLVWTLRAPGEGFLDLRSFLESLIAASRFLEPAEWETRPAEPWLNLILKGPWQAESPGLYSLSSDSPTFVHLAHEQEAVSLAGLRSSIAKTFQNSYKERGYVDNETLGAWRGFDAIHVSVDAKNDALEPRHARATWLTNNQSIFSLLVWSAEETVASQISRDLLEGFRGM